MTKIGENIYGWCTTCKLVLMHTIEAMVGGKITRVHCNTCRAQHAYRAKPPGASSAIGRVRARQTNGETSSEQKTRPTEYEVLMRGHMEAAVRPYATSSRFKVREIISHATFGLGAVTAERDNIKIDVLFADGARVLVHRR